MSCYGPLMNATETATVTHIGTCRRNKAHRFVATTAAEMATVCPICPAFENINEHGQPYTVRAGIGWKPVRVTVTATKCTGTCRSAKSDKCSCECGGRNHGRSLGLAR